MLIHDQWFYAMHVKSHNNRWLYNYMHKLHHEYTHSMNVFMTAYGELTENFVDVGYMLTPNDHQAHHLLRRYNYGLFFRFNDKFWGTYKKSTAVAYDVEYWATQVKSGEEARGKMDREHKKRIPLSYEEMQFEAPVTPWWEELEVAWGF
ncbi:hypothetical protein RQP46_005506 [Phenoliferia psychrophenolica]